MNAKYLGQVGKAYRLTAEFINPWHGFTGALAFRVSGVSSTGRRRSVTAHDKSGHKLVFSEENCHLITKVNSRQVQSPLFVEQRDQHLPEAWRCWLSNEMFRNIVGLEASIVPRSRPGLERVQLCFVNRLHLQAESPLRTGMHGEVGLAPRPNQGGKMVNENAIKAGLEVKDGVVHLNADRDAAPDMSKLQKLPGFRGLYVEITPEHVEAGLKYASALVGPIRAWKKGDFYPVIVGPFGATMYGWTGHELLRDLRITSCTFDEFVDGPSRVIGAAGFLPR
ncbi:hypothetical protein AYO47_01800 [Planctomyces sp. SCGC AG-212-M04]|nr:hypothetical protein AYO47_01800 [Planctomyces sp. SCGC AG-212-M04]